MVTKIYLVSNNKYDVEYSHVEPSHIPDRYFLKADTKLSPVGKKEMEEVASKISLDNGPTEVFYSPYTSSIQTFEILRKANIVSDFLKGIRDFRLAEQNFGRFDEMYKCTSRLKKPYVKQEIEAYDFYTKYPAGESLLDVYTRVGSFVSSRLMDEIRRETKNIIIITHKCVANMIIRYIFDEDRTPSALTIFKYDSDIKRFTN